MTSFRRYRDTGSLFEGDFLLVRKFLLELNNPTYVFGWWDHLVTRPSFQREHLSKLGLWLEGDRLVALACVEESLGDGALCVREGREDLLPEMAAYAAKNLNREGKLSLLVPDLDKACQEAAAGAGFRPTQERDTESILRIDREKLRYALPDGFRIVSMAENYDPAQFERVMRRGFGDDREERTLSAAELAAVDRQLKRPFVNLDLQIAAVAPDQSYAAFCGLWQTPESQAAFVEPVVTDPDYRRLGLGRAVLYEALGRCGGLGARYAVVFSSIQFYFNLGFRPNSTSTWWERG